MVISEAVRLAKAYSTERSGAFVNGVLGRLEREAAEGRLTPPAGGGLLACRRRPLSRSGEAGKESR